jgi:hypothetical protein
MPKDRRRRSSVIVKTLVAGAIGATLLVAGVVKTQFTDSGFFITGSSKITGNGSQFTVCEYFDQSTGKFVSEKQFPDIGLSNKDSLQAFCIINEPS